MRCFQLPGFRRSSRKSPLLKWNNKRRGYGGNGNERKTSQYGAGHSSPYWMDTSQGEDHANEVDRAMRSTIEIISRSIEMINVCSLQEKKILTLLIRAKDVYAPKRQRRRQREMENEDGRWRGRTKRGRA